MKEVLARMAIGLQSVFGVIALVGGLLASYDLLFGVQDWRATVSAIIARCWICVLLTTIGIDETFFGQNAVLQVGYLFGLPLLAMQIGFLASLVIAGYLWFGK